MRKTFLLWMALVMILAFSGALPVWAGVPTDKVRETTDKIIAIVGDPALKEPAKEAQRRERHADPLDDTGRSEASRKKRSLFTFSGSCSRERTLTRWRATPGKR
jgi:hypothetical protein